MSAMITSIICSLVLNISIITINKELIKPEENIMEIKNIFFLIILSVVQTIFYSSKYSVMYIITNFLAITLFNRIIFKESMTKILISSILVFIILMLCDLIDSIIMINFVSLDNSRNIWYLRIVNNIIVAIFCYILFSLPIVKKKCKYFISKFKNRYIPVVVLFIILVVGIIMIAYNISITFKWNADYLSNILIVVILISFCYIFINENNEYHKLNDEYDSLFQCIQTFEDWIEKEQLNRHEYKNQLAVLRCMTKEKKVKEKIDSIILDNININNTTVNQLKPIPNGGLKGLLYYKIVVAQNHKLNIEIDVSIKTPNLIKQLSEEKMKVLCRLIGIYLDNAIEAAKETKKKIISIEIYEINKEVHIAISNMFNQNKDINRRNEKGYTTKGKGHGNGLYFARKMLDKNPWIKEKQDIKKDLYIQKIILKNKKQ